MRIFLGIDGGQSSTRAVVGDETGRVLGEGQAGPCNHVGEAERRGKFFAAVGDSVRMACERAGVPPRFAGACAGFSGGAADKDSLTRELIAAERYLITHDAHIALAGATAGGPGIIVIAGTGSIAFGRNRRATVARAGGWGYVFGDEGSAFDIARQALRVMLRMEEGWGPATALRDVLLTATGMRSANDLLHACYTTAYPRERVAQWATLVDGAAGEGDAAAVAILDSAAQALATLAAAVRGQLFAGETSRVHYAGGVFQSRLVLERFRLLTELTGESRVLPPQHDPAHGALFEAIRLGA